MGSIFQECSYAKRIVFLIRNFRMRGGDCKPPASGRGLEKDLLPFASMTARDG